jgi:hypothetical protein
MYAQVVDGLEVQTPVRQFTHPDTGRTVTVIGTCHLGELDYYRGLREVIDKLEANGAVVQCEGANIEPDLDNADEQEREVLLDMRRAAKLLARRLTEIGWVDQHTGLGYPPSWQRTDMTNLEIIRGLGLPLARKQARKSLSRVTWPDGSRRGPLRLALQVALFFGLGCNDVVLLRSTHHEQADAIVIASRDMTALEAVAATDTDVVMIWGLAHLPGIYSGLTDLGFEETGVPQWHTVVQERPSMIAALCRLILGRAPRRPGRSS